MAGLVLGFSIIPSRLYRALVTVSLVLSFSDMIASRSDCHLRIPSFLSLITPGWSSPSLLSGTILSSLASRGIARGIDR